MRLSLRTRTASPLAVITLCLAALLVPAPAHAAWTGSKLCTHTNPEIKETSGLSRSTYKRKVLFLHNDSGDKARFFAVSRDCETKAVITINGVKALDWEDMAPGPDHTLWFGDIGDNGEKRASISVVRVTEPKELSTRSINGTSFELVYPDGAHNAEAMMIRPKRGRLYIITKNRVSGTIYRAPLVLDPNRPNVMTKLVEGVPNGLSGAEFARQDGRFVLRGYKSVFIYSEMGGEPTRVPVPSDHTFGEAVTWSRSGGALFLGAEGVGTAIWKLKES